MSSLSRPSTNRQESPRVALPVVESNAPTSVIERTERCDQCKLWVPKGVDSPAQKPLGECHYQPASILSPSLVTRFGPMAIFSLTEADCFCSHFKSLAAN